MPQEVSRAEFDELRERVARIEGGRGVSGAADTGGEDRFWLVRGVRDEMPAPGGVAHGGHVVLPDGREAIWQVTHGTQDLLAEDWTLAEAALRGLAHRHRLELLHDLLAEPRTALQLEQTGRHGTTGQIYNHLRQLVDSGWVRAERRGVFGVPVHRVVPLLVVLSISRGEV